MKIVSAKDAARLYAPRPEWGKKGDFGRLLCIGGSDYYPTAPALVSLSAMKAGADWSYILAPERSSNICSSLSPNMMSYPLKGRFLKAKHAGFILSFLEKYDAAVIGNGLGRKKETQEAVRKILGKTSLPFVIDADAIHAVARDAGILNERCLLTPHSNEFFALAGEKAENEIRQRIDIVSGYAEKHGCTILLKGHIDVISDGRRVAINKTGCPQMAKAGTGDVLAGIAGALLARHAKPFDAACSAAYLNGLAGEIAGKRYGESLLASDVIGCIHEALKMLQ